MCVRESNIKCTQYAIERTRFFSSNYSILIRPRFKLFLQVLFLSAFDPPIGFELNVYSIICPLCVSFVYIIRLICLPYFLPHHIVLFKSVRDQTDESRQYSYSARRLHVRMQPTWRLDYSCSVIRLQGIIRRMATISIKRVKNKRVQCKCIIYNSVYEYLDYFIEHKFELTVYINDH